MSGRLTEEEKEILFRAHEIKERIRAEELESGEISLEDAEREAKEEEELLYEDTEEHSDRAKTAAETEAGYDGRSKEDSAIVFETAASDGTVKKDRREKKRTVTEEGMKTGKKDEHSKKSGSGKGDSGKKKRKRKGWFGKFIKVIVIIAVILAVLIAGLYGTLRIMAAKTNYVPLQTSFERGADVFSDPGVTNILLIGTDSRTQDDASRSDAIIILSLNRKKGKVVMSSILRDSYVEIPGYGQNRINHSYQMGGEALLIQTIEQNFKVGIDYYIQVDFYNFIEVVDAFGGVEIEITPEELNYVNGYVSEVNHLEGQPEGFSFLSEPGLQMLNGRQALGYSRIRYIGTDFARTGRQRTVLEALMKRAKSNPFKILSACNAILPDLKTNIDDEELVKILMTAPIYLIGSTEQFRVPADGCWWNGNMPNGQEVLMINFEGNNALLHSAIYD